MYGEGRKVPFLVSLLKAIWADHSLTWAYITNWCIYSAKLPATLVAVFRDSYQAGPWCKPFRAGETARAGAK